MRKIDQVKLAILALDRHERVRLKAWIATLQDEEHSTTATVAPAPPQRAAGGRRGRGRTDEQARAPDPEPQVQRNKI